MSSARTVLIVDDDEEIRHVLRMLFEHDGFVVVGEAADGIGGVRMARETRPAFIVLDQGMPGLSGERTSEVLRALCPDMRIVAFSAFLAERPEWADAWLNKDRIGELVPLLTELADARNGEGQQAS